MAEDLVAVEVGFKVVQVVGTLNREEIMELLLKRLLRPTLSLILRPAEANVDKSSLFET